MQGISRVASDAGYFFKAAFEKFFLKNKNF